MLGNNNIISEILTEFENNENIGFIYPEIFYKVFKNINFKDIYFHSYQINLLLNEIFPKYKILKNNFGFPEEVNMFWSKTNAIHQIFEKNIVL